MVQFIPSPDPHALLPPLLACLPTSFASPRPPPALLPLLSPILRQRVSLLATSGTDSWLPLLNWDHQRASKLPKIVEDITIEPHPSSGEIEIDGEVGIKYRRRDEETLEARLEVEEFRLLPIYLWSTTDEGAAWRLTELRALEDLKDGTEWFPSMDEANEASKATYIVDALRANELPAQKHIPGYKPQDLHLDDEDGDDDYWNAYDRTPGRTPARTPAKQSPAPRPGSSSVQPPSASELEYFARYAAEVQPALDAHDPDEESPETGASTLNGDALTQQLQTEPAAANIGPAGYDSSLPPVLANGGAAAPEAAAAAAAEEQLSHPRPESAASLSSSVERMEQEAARQTQAETGIKQHISTDIKSLFRLARTVGIQRDEFERIVKTELEMLSMFEADD
ncbi:uncharacterized protein K452DRAFT_70988 [Aplosporella prunicola CBS 121167]|uniref:Uncharacterized protein n=1 Tax=Aplosporella prunicola CBS 121167 TaxID=1176127 RepID=A0A6A6BRS8_9PEZI|nr:uncharacterized protein K452DRAFT_70988 [Aplosporella prunicola CBS 121167]KAF2146796.1 hypothetical protein K452DRAFT_70988 [Aplosporella prunicola CBS 121167]